MTIVGQDYHRKKSRFYGCAYYKTRGSSICKNSLLVEQEVLDKVLLKSLGDVLTEHMLKIAVDKALVADTQALLGRQMSTARRLLKTLIDQPLHCEAVRKEISEGIE